MVCTYDVFYDKWRSCTISYTFGTLPDRIGAYRYISAITSCDRLIIYKENSMPQPGLILLLVTGLRCLNPAIGQCGDNGSGRMTGVPLKSEFLFLFV